MTHVTHYFSGPSLNDPAILKSYTVGVYNHDNEYEEFEIEAYTEQEASDEAADRCNGGASYVAIHSARSLLVP